jgi:hypothetical protein
VKFTKKPVSSAMSLETSPTNGTSIFYWQGCVIADMQHSCHSLSVLYQGEIDLAIRRRHCISSGVFSEISFVEDKTGYGVLNEPSSLKSVTSMCAAGNWIASSTGFMQCSNNVSSGFDSQTGSYRPISSLCSNPTFSSRCALQMSSFGGPFLLIRYGS